MPYVNVWVDDLECDGDCESAREAEALKKMVDEAVSHLRNGDHVAALSALTDDKGLPCQSPGEIKLKYQAWMAGRLPGFTNFNPKTEDRPQ